MSKSDKVNNRGAVASRSKSAQKVLDSERRFIDDPIQELFRRLRQSRMGGFMYFGVPDDLPTEVRQGLSPGGTPSVRRTPLPYREAMEEMERKLMADMARDCANVDVLQTLERVARSPAERVTWLERKISSMPRILEGHRLLRELFARRRAGRLNNVQLRAALMGLLHAFPEISEFPLPPGYAAGTVDEEVARARCELSRARWELMIFDRTGRVPGRLPRP